MNKLALLLAALCMLSFTAIGCGGVPDDDTKLSDVEENQQAETCDDVCEESGTYSYTCSEGDVEVTLSGGTDKAACTSQCVTLIANVSSSCGATVGTLRTALAKPENCEEAEAGVAAALTIASCQ